MKKALAFLLSVLVLCSLFSGCETEEQQEIAFSGDLAYYTALDEDTRKDGCKGKYIEVSGTVSTAYYNIGNIYIGELFGDEVRFDCSFSDSESIANIEVDDIVTIQGKCSNYYGSVFRLSDCQIISHTKAADVEGTTEPSTSESTKPTSASEQPESTTPTSVPAASNTTTATTSNNTTEPTISPTTTPTTKPTEAPTTKPTETPTTRPTEAPTPSEEMVWIPTKGGTKYHSRSSCSQMENPEYVTRSEAVSRGFTPCGRCR